MNILFTIGSYLFLVSIYWEVSSTIGKYRCLLMLLAMSFYNLFY